tara:strand:+ start:22975 stop:24492 length:1518 start_codon:yes stop_codon:yes gene_type:complete
MSETNIITIEPQKGYQLRALSSKADIVIGGGAAGTGKTYSLLLEFLRHINNPGWGGVIFRRTSPQIRNEGGLWDTSMDIFPHVDADPRESSLEWKFPKGAKLKFSHLEYEKNKFDWQGSQIPFIGFDELTHFSESMFFYLLSRNRSVCGVKPYVRATCNPDPDSWVANLISWWIDQDTGFPIPERDGKVRYFCRDGKNYIWGDSERECIDKAWYFLEDMVKNSGIDPKSFIKSITFVSGSIYDNKKLLEVNPEYLGNLASQDEAQKKILLDGNWKTVISENDIYEYNAFKSMFDSPFSVRTGEKYITADIALKGSDKFFVFTWDGDEAIDCEIMDKSDGKEVVDAIKAQQVIHLVPNHQVTYDNDGVGGFIDGYIPGAIPFKNGSKALPDPESDLKKNVSENYQNLKTQCYYRSGNKVNNNLMKISDKVANTMYDDKMTVRQRMIYERKAIKRDKVDADGKLRIVSKEEMKANLNGQSPDVMDAFMMKTIFDLKKQLNFAVWIED